MIGIGANRSSGVAEDETPADGDAKERVKAAQRVRETIASDRQDCSFTAENTGEERRGKKGKQMREGERRKERVRECEREGVMRGRRER